jgi:hypothetical protein
MASTRNVSYGNGRNTNNALGRGQMSRGRGQMSRGRGRVSTPRGRGNGRNARSSGHAAFGTKMPVAPASNDIVSFLMILQSQDGPRLTQTIEKFETSCWRLAWEHCDRVSPELVRVLVASVAKLPYSSRAKLPSIGLCCDAVSRLVATTVEDIATDVEIILNFVRVRHCFFIDVFIEKLYPTKRIDDLVAPLESGMGR